MVSPQPKSTHSQTHRSDDTSPPSNCEKWTALDGAELHHLSRLPALRLEPILRRVGLYVTCLPYLRELSDVMQAVNSGEFKLHLYKLSSLEFSHDFPIVAAHADMFSRIELLTLDCFRPILDDFAQCMAAMPRLTDLTLIELYFTEFDPTGGAGGIAGLSSAPSLTSLTLIARNRHCGRMHFAFLCQLAVCTRLTHLRVVNKLRFLSPSDIDALTPPSSHLPQLVEFDYKQPGEDFDYEQEYYEAYAADLDF